MSPGVHGVSNHLLDTPWPKVLRGRGGLSALLEERGSGPASAPALFDLLEDTEKAPDALLPDTGVGLAWERLLSPLHIRSETYGTRSATLLFMARNGRVTFSERTYAVGTSAPGITRDFTFPL